MSECPQRPASDSRVSASEARESHFLAILSRMKYIERWALMRSSRPENLSEHALDVALIAHVLASLGNARHGRHLDADRAAVLGLFHDASEIITGDMPTPVKYHDATINEAYKAVEAGAEARLLATLPEDLRDVAGALYDGSPAPGARAALAAAFLNAFWPLYRAGPRSGYLDEYRRRQALTGQRVLVTPRRGTPRAAQVQGIDDECKLVVRFDGESRPAALNSGEVSVRLL